MSATAARCGVPDNEDDITPFLGPLEFLDKIALGTGGDTRCGIRSENVRTENRRKVIGVHLVALKLKYDFDYRKLLSKPELKGARVLLESLQGRCAIQC